MANNKYYQPRNASLSRVERIVRVIAGIDDELNPNKYNFNKVVNYQCRGYDLTGSSCNTRDSKRHFLVNNNHYDVWEIPMRSNKGLHLTGEFYCLIKNIDFGFWICCKMKHTLYKDKYNIINEKVMYTDIGELQISECQGNISVYCTEAGAKCCRGYRTAVFDDDNVRKENGYHTTKKVINRSFGIQTI